MAQAQQEQGRKAETVKPFVVRVDGAQHGSFNDVKDAIAAAQIVKRERPSAVVNVSDTTTGQVLVEPDF